MEEYGIGTDATVADHIQKQLERGYATKDPHVRAHLLLAAGEGGVAVRPVAGLLRRLTSLLPASLRFDAVPSPHPRALLARRT